MEWAQTRTLHGTPGSWETVKAMGTWVLTKLTGFCTARESLQRKRQHTELDEIFDSCISDRGLISGIYKEVQWWWWGSSEGGKSCGVAVGSVCKFLMPSRDLPLNIDGYHIVCGYPAYRLLNNCHLFINTCGKTFSYCKSWKLPTHYILRGTLNTFKSLHKTQISSLVLGHLQFLFNVCDVH